MATRSQIAAAAAAAPFGPDLPEPPAIRATHGQMHAEEARRLGCLALAVQSRSEGTTPEQIVARARVYDEFVRGDPQVETDPAGDPRVKPEDDGVGRNGPGMTGTN